MLRVSNLIRCAKASASTSPTHRLRFGKVDFDALQGIFERLRVVAAGTPLAGRWSNAQLLAPLFTDEFNFHNFHHSAHGEVLIRAHVSDALLQHALHREVAVTPALCAELMAVATNHFVLRMFAEELGFSELVARPLNAPPSKSDTEREAAEPLDFLRVDKNPLSVADVAGTSFYNPPERAGQSSLAWKLTHLIGSIGVELGVEPAMRAIDSLWGLSAAPSLPMALRELLGRIIERYDAASVAHAVLTAQGFTAVFRTRSFAILDQRSGGEGAHAQHRELLDDHDSRVAGEAADGAPPSEAAETAASHPVAARASSAAAIVTAPGATVDALGARASLAAGPPGIAHDVLAHRWKQRALVEAEKAAAEAGVDSLAVSAAEATSITGGWVDPEEQRGAAFNHAVRFSTDFFADRVALPLPQQGAYVRRKKFHKPISDPVAPRAESDAYKKGLPFDAGGLTTPEAIERLGSRHRRQFEVSLICGPHHAETGVAVVDSRFTTARRRALSQYLGGVAHDLEQIGRAHV